MACANGTMTACHPEERSDEACSSLAALGMTN